jgi:hypothetical protein
MVATVQVSRHHRNPVIAARLGVEARLPQLPNAHPDADASNAESGRPGRFEGAEAGLQARAPGRARAPGTAKDQIRYP